MARIRTVKPEFWDSPDTARADLRTRLLYIAMWNWADDYGIGDASPVRLIGFAFPSDDIPAADYPRLLADVSSAFGVVYFEHEGRRFFAIPAWEQHQRTEKKAKPKPGLVEAAQAAIDRTKTAGSDDAAEISAESGGFSDEDRGSSFPGTGEEGTGEREEETSSSATPPTPSAPREDVEALCARLHALIIANGSKATVTRKWRTEARLLLDRDGRDLQKALNLVEWSQSDTFWRRNILSMPKFREKYDQLRLAAIADHEKRQGASPGGLSKREQKIAEAERFKTNPDPDLLRRAGLQPGAGLRALPGGVQ